DYFCCSYAGNYSYTFFF
nr:immunoglobulin light chain junction region [Macaca mulatta]